MTALLPVMSTIFSSRTFIMGTAPDKANKMFPNGVVYEGVSDEPTWFRGESGANDVSYG